MVSPVIMKVALCVLLSLLALGAGAPAPDTVSVSATATGLDADDQSIVPGFLELVGGAIESQVDINEMKEVLQNIRNNVEDKLKKKGQVYLEKLTETLANANENLNGIFNSIKSRVEQDGVRLSPTSTTTVSRTKRSPKKKFKKGKKGKKGGCG